MSKLERMFHEHLDILYPRGEACCFYESAQWSQLCHLAPQSKVNAQACRMVWGMPELIDIPVINVLPGSRRANIGSDKTILVRCIDYRIIKAGRDTMTAWMHKKKIDHDVLCAAVKPVYDLFYCDYLGFIIKAQNHFQFMVRNSHQVKKHAV